MKDLPPKWLRFLFPKAERIKRKRQEKGLIDKVSATIILQNFLEQRTR
jgi:putative Holliday junction resolvase